MVDPEIVRLLLDIRAAPQDSPLVGLTPREREVLAAMAAGKSNAAIAAELVLTKRAVEKHVGAIFLKLGLPSEDLVSRRVERGAALPAGRAATLADGGRTPAAGCARAPPDACPRHCPRPLRRWERGRAMVRVLTVDDHPPFRDAARAVIAATPGFEALAEVGSGEDAVASSTGCGPTSCCSTSACPASTGSRRAGG